MENQHTTTEVLSTRICNEIYNSVICLVVTLRLPVPHKRQLVAQEAALDLGLRRRLRRVIRLLPTLMPICIGIPIPMIRLLLVIASTSLLKNTKIIFAAKHSLPNQTYTSTTLSVPNETEPGFKHKFSSCYQDGSTPLRLSSCHKPGGLGVAAGGLLILRRGNLPHFYHAKHKAQLE